VTKKYLHHVKKKLQPVPVWVFAILFVVNGVVGVYSLRQNNTTMLKLRDAVAKADEQNGDTETALRNLREFVYKHMNTNLASGPNAIKPPIQLKYRYERLVKAEQDRINTLNGTIYTDAQAFCEKQNPEGLSGRGRVPCIQEYVTTHGGAQPQPIPDALYKFDFVSPTWSPDLAGWSLVISGVSVLLLVLRFGLERWLKHDLQ
jgi:hypothetical protein